MGGRWEGFELFCSLKLPKFEDNVTKFCRDCRIEVFQGYLANDVTSVLNGFLCAALEACLVNLVLP